MRSGKDSSGAGSWGLSLDVDPDIGFIVSTINAERIALDRLHRCPRPRGTLGREHGVTGRMLEEWLGTVVEIRRGRARYASSNGLVGAWPGPESALPLLADLWSAHGADASRWKREITSKLNLGRGHSRLAIDGPERFYGMQHVRVFLVQHSSDAVHLHGASTIVVGLRLEGDNVRERLGRIVGSAVEALLLAGKAGSRSPHR